jgi:hypothetical protein
MADIDNEFKNIIDEVERTENELISLNDVYKVNWHPNEYVDWICSLYREIVPFPDEEVDADYIKEIERILLKFINENSIDYFNTSYGHFLEVGISDINLNKAMCAHLRIANELKHNEIADIIIKHMTEERNKYLKKVWGRYIAYTDIINYKFKCIRNPRLNGVIGWAQSIEDYLRQLIELEEYLNNNAPNIYIINKNEVNDIIDALRPLQIYDI